MKQQQLYFQSSSCSCSLLSAPGWVEVGSTTLLYQKGWATRETALCCFPTPVAGSPPRRALLQTLIENQAVQDLKQPNLCLCWRAGSPLLILFLIKSWCFWCWAATASLRQPVPPSTGQEGGFGGGSTYSLWWPVLHAGTLWCN